MEENKYLGQAKISKLLLKFAIPCILSLLISALYNIVDQIFVGNGVGYLGNAATGVIFPITVIGWGVSLFFGDGAAAALLILGGRIVGAVVLGNVVFILQHPAVDQEEHRTGHDGHEERPGHGLIGLPLRDDAKDQYHQDHAA